MVLFIVQSRDAYRKTVRKAPMGGGQEEQDLEQGRWASRAVQWHEPGWMGTTEDKRGMWVGTLGAGS